MTAPETVPASGGLDLSARVAGFVNHLRLNAFPVGLKEAQDMSRVLGGRLMPLSRVRQVLKVMACGSHEDWAAFDDLFEAYWIGRGRERTRRRSAKHSTASTASHRPTPWNKHFGEEDAPDQISGALEANEDGSGTVGLGSTGRIVASDKSLNARADFRTYTDPEEMAAAEKLAYRIASSIRYRLSRRHRIHHAGRRVDLRRTIRKSLGRGGELMDIHRRKRPDRPVRLVVFLDVSGSMKLYSRFFLQFVKGLVCTWVEAEAFLIHTRLVRVTDAVREKNSMRAMTRLALMADGFGGGTKIGQCLSRFNDDYARRVVNARTVAVVISDGYDTGNPEELAEQLKRLKRRVRRLVWLNPLLGWEHYEPVTAAMALALRHIDHFAACNSLASLTAIEADLARV